MADFQLQDGGLMFETSTHKFAHVLAGLTNGDPLSYEAHFMLVKSYNTMTAVSRRVKPTSLSLGRYNVLRLLYLHELKMLLRARRTVIMAVVLPAVIMPLMIYAQKYSHDRRERMRDVLEQVSALMGQPELGGLLDDLTPATRDLAAVTDESLDLLPQTDLLSKCARDNLLPTGNVVIRDEFQTGRENYKDFFYALVGLAGEGQNLDGNGQYVRFQTGGGAQQLSFAPGDKGFPPQFGALPTPPLGNRPAMPSRKPVFDGSKPCYKQTPPDLNGPAARKTAPINAGGSTTAVKDTGRLREDFPATGKDAG